MALRHIMGVALCWGVLSSVGGHAAQAATPNSVKFVNLILSKQTKAIKADTKALNTRDKDVAKLEATTNPRTTKQLENSLSKLHHQILSMTTRLQAEATRSTPQQLR
jgi:hypothetical protein